MQVWWSFNRNIYLLFITQAFKHTLNTANNEMISGTFLAFFSHCRVLPSWWGQQSYFHEGSLFTLAKPAEPAPLVYSFTFEYVRSWMQNYFFWRFQIAMSHLLSCYGWHRIMVFAAGLHISLVSILRLQEPAQLKQCLGLILKWKSHMHFHIQSLL